MSEAIMRLVGDIDLSTGEIIPPALPVVAGAWLSLADAARRANPEKPVNLGLIRRWILENNWIGKGLARVVKLPSGQSGYEINESADPKFARVKPADQLAIDFRSTAEYRQLPARVRDRANEIEAVVREWERRLSAATTLGLQEKQTTDAYLTECRSRGIKVSRASLYNWRRDYRKQGLRGLLDHRAGNTAVDAEQFWLICRELYLNPRKLELTECYESAVVHAKLNDLPYLSYKQVQRRIAALPEIEKVKRREGEKAFNAKCEPYIPADYNSIRCNEWWVSDDHTFDVRVIVGYDAKGNPKFGRPFLHGWQDRRSRKIVGWRIQAESPNSQTVLGVFREAVRKYGRPKIVHVDNGAHYDSRALQTLSKRERRGRKATADRFTEDQLKTIGGAFTTLGCEVVHAKPYRGQSKLIERFFREVCHKFSKYWSSYCGPGPERKPETLKAAIASGNVPTIEEFAAEFDAWLPVAHNGRPHTGHAMDGRTPDEVYAECEPEFVADELLEWATFTPRGPVTVHRNGVTWKGQHYGWCDERLLMRQRTKVMLRIDERVASHIYVCDLSGALICRAEAMERMPLGADQQALADTLKKQAAVRRLIRQAAAEKPALHQTAGELMYQAKAEKHRRRQVTSTPVDPPPMKIARTPFDVQLPAIRRAIETAKTSDGHTPNPPAEIPSFAQIMQHRKSSEVTDE